MIFLFKALLFAALSHSAPLPIEQAFRFTQVKEALSSVNANQKSILEKLEKSVVLLNSDDGRCTGSYISNQGHILTARHCLQRCLVQSEVFKFESEQGLLTYFKLDPSQLGQAQCELKIGDSLKTIIIDATSPGFIAKIDEPGFSVLNPELFAKLVEEGFTSRGDFVVFHVKKAEGSPTEKTPCLPLTKGSSQTGDFIQSLSFPGETARSDGFNSDGKSPFVSAGYVIEKIEDNKCVKDLLPQMQNLHRFEQVKKTFNEPTAVLSTLDSVFGSSGAPVVDRQGGIVGLLSNVYRHRWLTGKEEDEPVVRYCEGSSKALKIEQVRKIISQQGDLLSRISCED